MADLTTEFTALQDPDDWDARVVTTLERLRTKHGEGTELRHDGALTVSEVSVFPSAVHVRGDFVFSSHVLVLGDLRVDGVIIGEPEHAILMVAGNVSARAMAFLRSYLCVTGSLDAAELLLGTSDGFARVKGATTTGLFLQEHWEQLAFDDEDDEAEGMVKAGARLDMRSSGYRKSYPRPYESSEPRLCLSEAALRACARADDERGIDPWELLEFVRQGGSVTSRPRR